MKATILQNGIFYFVTTKCSVGSTSPARHYSSKADIILHENLIFLPSKVLILFELD